MTSEIRSESINPIEPYSTETEYEETNSRSSNSTQGEEVPIQSQELLPNWKVEELEKKVKRAAVQAELKKAVANQDMEAFSTIYTNNNKDLIFISLVPVYTKAVHETPITFVRELEKFVAEQEKHGLRYMLGNMDDPKAMKALVTSPLIKVKYLSAALNEYFQESALHGNYYEGGRKGELPHRLELAQILIDHGANPFDEKCNQAWGVALSNRDIEGLKMMMNHPKFDPNVQKIEYISNLLYYKFGERFDTPKIWGDECTVGIREAKSACKLYEALGLVPTSDKVLTLVEDDVEHPILERKFLAAIYLPFIDYEVEGLSLEMKTHLAMDLLKFYPHIGLFNSFIFQGVVEPAATQLLNLDSQTIAQRILTDAFKTDIEIPKWPKDVDVDEEYSKATDIYYLCTGLVTKGYGYHLLIQDEKVRGELLKLEGGKEQVAKIELFHGKLLEAFGPLPWEGIDEIEDFEFRIYNLANENFAN